MREQSTKKENRKILRYVIVPVAAVLLIALGALALRSAIRADQAQTDGETVSNPVLLEQVSTVPQYEDIMSHIGQLPDGCRAIAASYPEDIAPPASAITIEEAAAIGVWNIQLAFETTVTGDVFVYYEQYDGMTVGTYSIYAGGTGSLDTNDWDNAPYFCLIDSVTGEMRAVQKRIPSGEQEQPDYFSEEYIRASEESHALMAAAGDDPEFEKRAIAFITENYLRDGQTIAITFIDGVQWSFRGDGFSPVVLDCYVTVQPGTSYCLRMEYPGYGIESIQAYSEEEAANEPVFDVEWVKEVKEAQRIQDALPTTPTPVAPERTPMSDEAIIEYVKERIKEYGYRGGYPDPEDPTIFMEENGYIVSVDLETGEKESIFTDPPMDYQRALRIEEFRSLFRSYEEYLEENF